MSGLALAAPLALTLLAGPFPADTYHAATWCDVKGGEQMFFSCTLQDKQVLSICGMKGEKRVEVRLGKGAKPTLVASSGLAMAYECECAPSQKGYSKGSVKFQREKTRYSVYSITDERVRAGWWSWSPGEDPVTVPCVGAVNEDFRSLQPLVPALDGGVR